MENKKENDYSNVYLRQQMRNSHFPNVLTIDS